MSINSIKNLKSNQYSKASIFAGAKISGVNFESLDNSYIVAVDKGLEYLKDNDIEINVALGDFDSLDSKYFNDICVKEDKVITFNKDKDMTDLELSINHVIDMGIKNIDIYGGIGSRLDHTLANIYMLKKYKNYKITLINENNKIIFVEDNIEINKTDKYKYISFLPTNDICKFSVNGVKWPLQNHHLEYGSSLTVSNEIISIANIEIHEGNLFVILSKD
nr:thiamine diphosphokinase [Helcococcus sueciensis]